MRSGNRNVELSLEKRYSQEKVKFAIEFVRTHSRRTTPIEEYIKAHNYLKDDNVQTVKCRPCSLAKYISSVENFATYGRDFWKKRGYDLSQPTPQEEEQTPTTKRKKGGKKNAQSGDDQP